MRGWNMPSLLRELTNSHKEILADSYYSLQLRSVTEMYASSNLIPLVPAWFQDYKEASVDEEAVEEEVIPSEAEAEEDAEIIPTLIIVVQSSVQL